MAHADLQEFVTDKTITHATCVKLRLFYHHMWGDGRNKYMDDLTKMTQVDWLNLQPGDAPGSSSTTTSVATASDPNAVNIIKPSQDFVLETKDFVSSSKDNN